jgi:glycine/D-amino acid oxidase-like deaminating enzyme
VTGIAKSGDGLVVTTRRGVVRANRVALATNAYPPLLRRLRNYIVPVYDYVLMTDPLTDAQWSTIGWSGREGVSDTGNQFHYYRSTDDGRILWGGYDALYYGSNGFGPRYEHNRESYERLAEHFLQTFPQLRGIRFSHAWGGAIDTCSRFTAFWGTAMQGRVGYVVGYTGLGVGASRFGAATMLDLLDGRETERTRLEMVKSKPIPFPPEPIRSGAIALTTRELQRADANDGRRGPWLGLLDRLGLGFDS